MNKIINVSIMSGAGNIFSVIDNSKYNLSITELSDITNKLCNIQFDEFHKNTEGLISMSKSNRADFDVQFFNPDGSHGPMCGNGARCAVAFAKKHSFINGNQTIVYFLMQNINYKAIIKENTIIVFFPSPNIILPNKEIQLKNRCIKGGFVNVNSDHYVIDFNDLEESNLIDFKNFNLSNFAQEIRYHNDFENGTNVNIYSVNSNKLIYLRTYERGVEAETGACGTGTISTAIIARIKNNIGFPLEIIPSSGKSLFVDIIGSVSNKIQEVLLEGNAEFINYINVEIN